MSSPYLTQMSLWEAPRANPGRSAQTGRDQQMIAISGQKCLDSFAAAGRDVSLLKTLMAAYHEGLQMKYAWIWKPRLTPQYRLVCQLEPLGHHTAEIAYSLWPTPSASDNRVRQPPARPHITKNGTLRHINKQGTQSAVRTSQAVRFWDGDGYENPEWKELLMGLPPGWTDLRRQTSPDGRHFRAKHRKAMNRHVSKQMRALMIIGVLRRSATPSYGSKYTRLHKRLKSGWTHKRRKTL